MFNGISSICFTLVSSWTLIGISSCCILSLLLSIYLFFFMQSEDAKLYGIFVGLWVPSILSAYRVIESSVSAYEIDQEDEPEINETK